MPPLKKRHQIFLDSSDSDDDSDDENNSDDDFDISGSDSESDDDSASASASKDDVSVKPSRASNRKKSTPSMILSPECGHDDEENEVKLVEIDAQESNSKEPPKRIPRKRNRQDIQQESIAKETDNISTTNRDDSQQQSNRKSRTTTSESASASALELTEDGDDFKMDEKSSSKKGSKLRLKLNRAKETKKDHVESNVKENRRNNKNTVSQFKSVKVVIGGDSADEPIIVDNDDNNDNHNDNDETNDSENDKKNESTRMKKSKRARKGETQNIDSGIEEKKKVNKDAKRKENMTNSTSKPSSLPKDETNTTSTSTVQKPLSQNSVSSLISSNASIASKPPSSPAAISTTYKPKKKKKQTFQNQILTHLLTTLKPFTLKTLANDMRTSSIALNHLMLSLIDKKIVIKREWGKNKNKELYWIDIPNAMREVYGKDYSFDLKGTEDSKVEYQHLKNQEMTLSREIDTVNMQISNEELNKQLNEQESIVQNLKNRVNGAKERIAGTKSGSNKSNTPSSSLKRGRFQPPNPPIKSAKQIIKDFNYMRTEWKNRKEKCMDFLDNLSDAMEKKPKDVIKLLDIETDEAMGVKLPKKM